ncbi:hypothetical protein F5Y18DRAFT_407155 [Xylariaceae sp. FL1019]|nr:hypothetical protein F5Y18DRAFT_407155 [Xylariaceae sp. FL1019]
MSRSLVGENKNGISSSYFYSPLAACLQLRIFLNQSFILWFSYLFDTILRMAYYSVYLHIRRALRSQKRCYSNFALHDKYTLRVPN